MNNYDPSLILRAKAELELRRRKRERKYPFREWLADVCPRLNWEWPHLSLLIDKLQAVCNGDIKRLMVFMPPRHGKSTLGTIRFPAYILERDPSKRIMVGSYNQTLADKFSRATRKIVEGRISTDKDRRAVSDWRTGNDEGGLRAVGVGSGATGQGADFILIDDPIKSRAEANSETYRENVYDWYTNDIYTRLEPGGSIVLTMTRWHELDLAGRILESEAKDSWEIINLPALAEPGDILGRTEGQALCPERYNEQQLAEIKTVLGAEFQALYQQRPSAIEGAIFKREYWQYYKVEPNFNLKVLSIDTAFKVKSQNDYSVINFYGKTNNASYMVNRWKAKVEYPELKRAVVAAAAQFHPNEILIEDKASGQSLIQELRRDTNLPIIPVQVDTDKISRANAAVGYIEAGKLLLPETSPWLLDYLDTMATFPNAAHDDDVDATTQYIARHGLRPRKEFIMVI